MEYKVKGLNQLSKQLHKFQIDAGFSDSNIVQRLMLVHSEISEAFEAFRDDKYADLNTYEECEKATDILSKDMPDYINASFELLIKDTLQDEIADSIIRLLAFCAENNIDIEKHIQFKMKYNKLRGFKYGGKKF